MQFWSHETFLTKAQSANGSDPLSKLMNQSALMKHID